jgi:hypothetical protein
MALCAARSYRQMWIRHGEPRTYFWVPAFAGMTFRGLDCRGNIYFFNIGGFSTFSKAGMTIPDTVWWKRNFHAP